MRTKLTDFEFNTIRKLTSHTHLDIVFDVCELSETEDGWEDFEEGVMMPLIEGIELLFDALAYTWHHDGLTYEESKAIVTLFKEFGFGNDEWYEWYISNSED